MSSFLTGIMQDYNAQGRSAQGIRVLEELVDREDHAQCGTSTPAAVASAFGGNSRIIVAYATLDNCDLQIIGWLQLVRIDVLFCPVPEVRIGRFWLEDKYFKTNVYTAMLLTAKEFARETWQAQLIHTFAHQQDLVVAIEQAGGNVHCVSHGNWIASLSTRMATADRVNTLTTWGVPELSNTLATYKRWLLTPHPNPPSPKRPLTDVGSSSMG